MSKRQPGYNGCECADKLKHCVTANTAVTEFAEWAPVEWQADADYYSLHVWSTCECGLFGGIRKPLEFTLGLDIGVKRIPIVLHGELDIEGE